MPGLTPPAYYICCKYSINGKIYMQVGQGQNYACSFILSLFLNLIRFSKSSSLTASLDETAW